MITGVVTVDREAILRCLAPECVVIESYGPTYRGIPRVRRWVDGWLAPGNRVTRWDITSLHANGQACFFEWDFECLCDGELSGFEGASLARQVAGRIGYLREYAMTSPRYE